MEDNLCGKYEMSRTKLIFHIQPMLDIDEILNRRQLNAQDLGLNFGAPTCASREYLEAGLANWVKHLTFDQNSQMDKPKIILNVIFFSMESLIKIIVSGLFWYNQNVVSILIS
jgi:hypothetical protein